MTRKRKEIPNDPMPPKVVSIGSRRKIPDAVLAQSRVKPKRESPFTIPSFPSISLPPGSKRRGGRIAMDEQIIEVNAWATQNLFGGAFTNGATFLGYPYLAELSQIAEFRKITETTAMHMTRKFITLQSVGSSDEDEGDSKTKKIKEITDAIENFKLRDVFRKAAEVDGYFGRAHLYVDLGYQTPAEMKMPIGNGRDALSRLKIKPGMLKGFKVIEPVWTYPGNYNSNDPFTTDWYNPQTWFVLGKEVHHSRCMRMVGREVADLLKPAYAFGGLSLSQIAKPYVDNWLRTRQSVADVVWSFSTSGVSTDLSTLVAGQGEDLFARAELYNNLRNNRGLMMLNKDSEEFFQINTPLGTLDKLQAQAQEHMASVSSIPLVFLLGITPSGLNASSEGEIRAFYDFIHAFQAKFFTEPLTRCIDFIQLHLYGEIDPEITFIFEPLWSMDEKSLSEIDKTKAETDDLRINGGVISPLEARKSVANAPDTPYDGLDTTVIPVPPGGGGEEDPDDPDGGGDLPGPIGGEGLDPGKPKGEDHPRIGGASDDDDSPFADDSAFEEGKHPRGQPGNAGQFGAGGGGESSGGSDKPEVVQNARGFFNVKHNGEFIQGAAGGVEKTFRTKEEAEAFAAKYKPKVAKAPKLNDAGGKFKHVQSVKEYMDIARASERELSDADKAALAHYTSPEYAVLNKALRGDKDLSPQTQEIVDNLDRIISESTLSEPVTLFRGVRGKKVREVLDNLLPGDTLTDAGFVSTSLADHVASNQADAGKKSTMVIRAPKGANAVFPGEHSYNAQSGIDTAMEAVLPRESQFKFIGKKGTTYEFELVQPNQAHDEAPFEESKHPRAPNGQFGSGGSGGSTSPEEQKASVAKHVESFLKKPAGISGKYRQGIQSMLKAGNLSKEHETALKHKMVESYKAKANQLSKAGDPKASAVAAKAVKLEKALGTYNVPIKEAPAEKSASSSAKHTVDTSHAQPHMFIVKSPDGKVIGNNGESGEGIPTKKFDTKTEAEAYAKQLDDEAPEKEKKKAEADQKLKEQQEAAKEKVKKEAEAFAKEMSDPEVAKHYEVLKNIAGGLTTTRKEHLNGLIKEAGLEGKINAVDCALIQAYTGADYGPVNKQMRSGQMSKQQFGYAKSLQQALKKLPDFKGTVTRGTNLPDDVFKKYVPGYIVPERAFTSTGQGYKFSGTHTYEIESTHGKDVRNISSMGPGEQEVIFPAGSHFEVISVTGKHIKLRQVEDLNG